MKKIKFNKTKLVVNNSSKGETIEQKIERITINNEPIKDGAPLIYTERSEGVKAGYDIRTDRFEVALEGTTIIEKSVVAKREQRAKEQNENNGGAEPIQGTEQK